MEKKFGGLGRRELMSRIRSHGNKDTELAMARLFRRRKITGWRRQVQLRVANVGLQLPKDGRITRRMKTAARHFKVRPDFVFSKLRLAVFVDGCFWHGCQRHGTQPKGNAAFWRRKISRNKTRDRRVNRALRRAQWQVLRVWAHALTRRQEARLLGRVRRAVGDKPRPNKIK